MNRLVTVGGACLLAAGTVHAGLISPVLDEVLRQAAPDEVVSTLIYLHEVRGLHGQLEQVRAAEAALMAEHSRLLLERSALAAYQNVEHIAETQLDMRFPGHVEHLKQ